MVSELIFQSTDPSPHLYLHQIGPTDWKIGLLSCLDIVLLLGKLTKKTKALSHNVFKNAMDPGLWSSRSLDLWHIWVILTTNKSTNIYKWKHELLMIVTASNCRSYDSFSWQKCFKNPQIHACLWLEREALIFLIIKIRFLFHALHAEVRPHFSQSSFSRWSSFETLPRY